MTEGGTGWWESTASEGHHVQHSMNGMGRFLLDCLPFTRQNPLPHLHPLTLNATSCSSSRNMRSL